MGDFNKNPKKPFEVSVPNKIRKRIAMHEIPRPFKVDITKSLVAGTFDKITDSLEAISSKSTIPKKRGSMWSRFTNRIKKFLG